MDGDANGRIKCSLANWTGVAYKIPRTLLEKARSIDALKQTGVYLLFSADAKIEEICDCNTGGWKPEQRSSLYITISSGRFCRWSLAKRKHLLKNGRG